MDINEKKEEGQDTSTDTNAGGDKPQGAEVLDTFNATAERLEKANEKGEELLRGNQELEARKRLGGQSDAGQPSEKPKEETPKEYADRIMKGDNPEE